MKLWQKILKRLLYLTPIGYILGLLSLTDGGDLQGLKIVPFSKDTPIVTIKKDSSTKDRLTWFINGLFLFLQGWFAFQFFIRNRIFEQFVSWYVALSFIFGLVAIFSALMPKFPWNKRLW